MILELREDPSDRCQQILSALAEMLSHILQDEDDMAIVYGSYAYDIASHTSDIDVVVVSDTLDSAGRESLIQSFISFHRTWKLTLDDEVPFERKLVANWEDVRLAISGEFLPTLNGEPRLSKVVKTEEFLSSEELRLRLLLNALTGRTVQLLGQSRLAAQLQRKALE